MEKGVRYSKMEEKNEDSTCVCKKNQLNEYSGVFPLISG
jgi:hypothetical protein